MLIIDKSEIFRATEIIQSGLKQGLVVLKRQLVDGSASSGEQSLLPLLQRYLKNANLPEKRGGRHRSY